MIGFVTEANVTHVVAYVKAVTAGVMLAVVAQVLFTVCEFVVKYGYSLAVNGGVGGSPGASMAIPSPLSVVVAVAGFVYGYRLTLKSARPHPAH
jgi:hypothetical protein